MWKTRSKNKKRGKNSNANCRQFRMQFVALLRSAKLETFGPLWVMPTTMRIRLKQEVFTVPPYCKSHVLFLVWTKTYLICIPSISLWVRQGFELVAGQAQEQNPKTGYGQCGVCVIFMAKQCPVKWQVEKRSTCVGSSNYHTEFKRASWWAAENKLQFMAAVRPQGKSSRSQQIKSAELNANRIRL